jgi:hypothetical protein
MAGRSPYTASAKLAIAIRSSGLGFPDSVPGRLRPPLRTEDRRLFSGQPQPEATAREPHYTYAFTSSSSAGLLNASLLTAIVPENGY